MSSGQMAQSSLKDWLQYATHPATRTVVTVLLTSACILGGQALRRHRQRDALKDDVESSLRKRRRPSRQARDSTFSDEEITGLGMPVSPRNTRNSARKTHQQSNLDMDEPSREDTVFDETIIREFLARNYAFLGEDGCRKVRDAFCVVVGLGGVGSAAATMLVRSGVRKIRLIDFDQVTLSSLNRHASATLADVGTSKAEASRNFFAKIAPWIEVETRIELWSLEDAARLLEGNPDWVLDCIDNITTKVQLLKYCKDNNLQVFSAMGAASKCDPTRIQIADISNTLEDPLARSVRRRLKMEGVMNGIPVVYSTEKPNEATALLPLPEDEFKKGAVGELSALEAFRVRILPCLGPLPGMLGQAAAAYIVASLGGARLAPLAIKQRTKTYTKAQRTLVNYEWRLFDSHVIPFGEPDIEYLVEELHMGRSVVAPSFVVPTHATLIRWDLDSPLTWGNCVLMEREEANKHFEECLKGKKSPLEVWGEETCDLVRRRQDEDQRIRKWRL